MSRPVTLSQALIGTPSLARSAGMVLFGTVLLALSAQVSVPMYPVPMTLQTLAISLIGLTLGARLAGVTLLAYLAQGAMGLPVFAGGAAGLPYMLGPTGGFLAGFIAMAWLTGWMVERGLDRRFGRLFVAAFIPALLLFIPGVLWLWASSPLSLEAAFLGAAWPFLIGLVVKSLIAALIVAGGWQALKSHRG